jgi:glycosidase
LREDWLYPHPERLVTFLGNHDTVRFLSQPGVGVPELKIAFALLATLRGMPQIYSGDEIAMRGGADPDNRHDFPGGFPGDPQNAFTAADRTPEQANVHDWVAALFHFRHDHPVLATGQQQDIFVDPSAFVYVRTPDLNQGCNANGGGEHEVVAVNEGDAARDVQLDLNRTALAGCTVFTAKLGSSAVVHASGSSAVLSLPPKQAIIFDVQ